MDQVIPIEDKKSFLKNDRLLVCSMLGFYAFCILGLVGAAIWGLDRRSKGIAANATATAAVVATERAAVTATAIAHRTEQAQYSIVEPFSDNRRDWMVTSINDEYAIGSLAINGGLYAWNMHEVKKPFFNWADCPVGGWLNDFDTYVDVKVTDGSPDNICTGFLFRMASSDWEEGTYIFSVCNDSYYYVSYYEHEDWDIIQDWTYSPAIQNFDWNRLEISARGEHFSFIINDKVVSEMTDDRLSRGSLALFVEFNEEKPATIWFDNFGFQGR